jgi:phospholipid/cholesterol/gamma-HCH transport system substrate-binding protein
MYASRTTQLFVGIFTLMGIAALMYLSVRLGRVEIVPPPGYTLFANFDNIAGLKTGDQVEISGVKVGKVMDIGLKENRARVAMRVNEGVEVDDDAMAKVVTSGLIGDKYIAIALGGGDNNLKSGGTIRKTQSAFVLEDAIASFIGGGASSGSKSGAAGSNTDTGGKSDASGSTTNTQGKQ